MCLLGSKIWWSTVDNTQGYYGQLQDYESGPSWQSLVDKTSDNMNNVPSPRKYFITSCSNDYSHNALIILMQRWCDVIPAPLKNISFWIHFTRWWTPFSGGRQKEIQGNGRTRVQNKIKSVQKCQQERKALRYDSVRQIHSELKKQS